MTPAPGPGIAGRRVLTLTSLYPSVARPRHGIFVETRLRHLQQHTGIDARVIAPVPWFPFKADVFGAYARYAATPRHATRQGGLAVSHPRYWMLPRVGVARQPDHMAHAVLRDVARLQRSGWQPELIDAHYLYPDGVAAALVAARLHIPFVLTARGTDVNVLGRMPGPAQRIVWATQQASAVMAVSERLKENLLRMGVAAHQLSVVRNGVDLDVFHPEPPALARQVAGLPVGRLAICVGNLVPEKGFALAIEALIQLSEFTLVIVGEGPARAELGALALQRGVAQRVVFKATMPQAELRNLYSAADVLLLTSTREGWPNVVLEAMACGTPVVAVDVGAVGEMITHPNVGRVVAQRDPSLLARAVQELLDCDPPDLVARRHFIHQHAATFDWASVSAAQALVFSRALLKGQSA
jgi:teichuronic acid biosynthesis glycosyltransferase TuaC